MNFSEYTALSNTLPKMMTRAQLADLPRPMGFVELNDHLAPHPKIIRGVIPASPSSADSMATCPRQFDARYIGLTVQKLEYVQNYHAVRGDTFHCAAENFMHGVDNDLPTLVEFEREVALKRFEWTEKQLAFKPGILEYWDGVLTDFRSKFAPDQLTIESKFGYNQHTGLKGWRGRAVGMKSDLIIRINGQQVIYIDYKTGGKVYDGDISHKAFQLELTAQVLFKNDPNLKQISTQLWYIDHKTVVHYLFQRDLPFTLRIMDNGLIRPGALTYPEIMFNYWREQKERSFPANPNYLCQSYCDVRDCRHNGKN